MIALPEAIWVCESDVGIFPEMHAVRTDSESPADIDSAVIRPVRIVLVAHMKLAVHKDEPVRVIEPAAAGREVQLLTLGFSVDARIEIRTILYPPAGNYPVRRTACPGQRRPHTRA